MSLIVCIPLIFLAIPMVSLLSRRYTAKIAVAGFTLAFIFSVGLWMSLSRATEIISYPWFTSGKTIFSLTFIIEQSSAMTTAFATLVGLLVSIYALKYFETSERKGVFFSTLSLFMSAMTGLILSGNLLFSFVCWELVGLCSYLLIGFYREEQQAGKAATKALLMNKVGDIGFLIALMIVWVNYGTFDLTNLALVTVPLSSTHGYLIGIGLLAAIFAKSAQFPLHSWLPDAMAGPTPVSALIHSATMVAAGIWLIFRVEFILSADMLWIAGAAGFITALIGGWNALFQTKIKQLLAWSTISQLGLMMLAAGWGSTDSAVMHLITHGFFKSGLFLVAGTLLLQLSEKQEDELGAIASIQKGDRTLAFFLVIFTFSLAGLPLSSSFLSKEAIAGNLSAMETAAFFGITALTILYSIRMIWLLKPFISNSEKKSLSGLTWPLVPLVVACGWWLWSADPLALTGYTLSKENNSHINLTFFAASFSVAIALLLYRGFSSNKIRIGKRKELILNFDPVLQGLVVHPIVKSAEVIGKVDRLVIDRFLYALTYGKVAFAHLIAAFDRYILDGLAETIAHLAGLIGQVIRKAANGTVQSYLWWSLIAFLILVIWQQ